MFFFGFLTGAAAATAFILYGNGELLIWLGEQIREVSRRYHEWARGSEE